LNWSSHPNSKRAFEVALSRYCAPGMAFRQIGGVRGDLVGDHAVFHIFLVRQT